MLLTCLSMMKDKTIDSCDYLRNYQNDHKCTSLNAFIDNYPTHTAYSHVVTVATQALTPHLLSAVLLDLANYFSPASVRFHHLHKAFGEDVIQIRGTLRDSDNAEINKLIGEVSDRYAIDLALQVSQASLSTPGLLVMDMDSTVISIECIDEIAKLANVGEEVAEVTAKAMRGEIAFNESLIHRVACLKSVPETALIQIRDSLPLMPGVQSLITTLKANNWKLAIASGGFTYFADYLKERLGLDFAISNTLEVKNGALTGEVIGPIVNAEVKAETITSLAREWQIPHSQTAAMGDGANDLLMMAQSALGVACHAKPVVNEKASVAIRRGHLHSMLYFLDK